MTADEHPASSGSGLGTPTAVQRWIVGNGLPGVGPEHGITVDDLVASAGWASANRLTGLLFAAASRMGVDVPEEISDAHLATLRQGLAVEAEACRVVTELRSVGIEPIVFKGVASAHLDHRDPGDRTFYDVDLLVARDSFAAAIEHLATAGWTRIGSALGSRWEARYARAAQFVAPNGVEIDLHAALAAGYFGVRLDHEALSRSTEMFELGGVEMTGFDVDARLLTSCYALVLSRGGSVRLVRDVAQQIIVTGASWERAALLAGEGDVVIAEALKMVEPWIGLPPGCADWVSPLSASRRQQVGLRLAAAGNVRGWRSDAAGELLGLGVVDRVRYLSGVARSRVPSTGG